jgi:membrane protease YdiL (CAAX protease family)
MDNEHYEEPETQPEAERVPPGGPPAVGTAVEDHPPARHWGVLETLPIILLLLLLTGVNFGSAGHTAAPRVNIRGILLAQGLLYGLLLLYVHAIIRIKYRLRFWSGLSWRPVERGKFLFSGLGLAIAVQILRLPVENKLPIERLFESRQAAYLLAAFGVLVAPLVEEILFRGFIFGGVERSWGLAHAVWITAVLFALVHVPQLIGGIPQMFAILGVGLVLSWVRARTRSLAASYFIHLGYNSTLFALLFISTHGFRQWS